MDKYDSEKFLHRDVTEKVIGVFYDVYNELGYGFLESIYHSAMAIALTEAGLRTTNFVKVPVSFRGRLVGDFIAAMLVEDKVLLELKAVTEFNPAHEAQLLNYKKATPVEIGLLLNFGPKPKVKRMAFTNDRNRILALRGLVWVLFDPSGPFFPIFRSGILSFLGR
jgi:GxxExxY protein